MAAYGEARETRDADLAVVDLRVARAQEVLEAAGLHCVVAIDDPGLRFGGLVVGRVSLVGGQDDLGLNVLDLVRTLSPRYDEAAMGRAIRVPLRDGFIRAVSPEDFVIFKALATRDRDREDAASVLRYSSQLLDLSLVETEVERLAAEIPDFDVCGSWEEIRTRAGSSTG